MIDERVINRMKSLGFDVTNSYLQNFMTHLINEYNFDVLSNENIINFWKEYISEKLKITLDKDLAIYLHKKLCTSNHTEGCYWHYDENNWEEYSHKSYLDKAQKILEITKDHVLVKKIVDILRV